MLDPQARALLDLMEARQVPPTHTLTPQQARSFYLERRFFSQPEPLPMALVQDLKAGDVPLRLYRPLGTTAAQVLPTLVYFHGGGWTMGDLDTHDVLCRQLAQASGCAVVAVDYRMGPEQPFPAAVDDCVAAVRWVHAQAPSLNLDAQRLAVGGDSAGGNLAAVVCLVLRDAAEAARAAGATSALEPQPQPLLQVLIYPATDMRATAPSHQSNGQGYLLTADTIRYFRGHYVANEAHWSDWRASPLLAPSLANLPPALVLTAGFDPLRDEGRAYADALSAAGNRAQYVCFERQIHGFITMGRVLDEAQSAIDLCAAVLRRTLTA